MPSVSLLKVLLFDDQMKHVLLERDDALSPFTGRVDRADSLTACVRRAMAPIIGIDMTKQPVWHHIRTEEFRDVSVHVFFGKLPFDELMKVEKFNRQSIISDVESLRSKTIAHRLRYLIPMCIVLDAIDKTQWPRP